MLKELLVLYIVDLECHLVPLLADPALHSIDPKSAFLDVLVAKHACENDFLHITRHRVLHQKVLSNLIDAHEHKGKLACGAVLVLLYHYNFSLDALTLRSQFLQLFEPVTLRFRPILSLLFARVAKHLEHFFFKIGKAFKSIKLLLDFYGMVLICFFNCSPLSIHLLLTFY